MAKDEKNKEETKAEKSTKPESGDAIHLVTARGKHLIGKILKIGRGGLAHLEVGNDLFTDSPHDPTGTIPDSWHLPETGAAAAVAPPAVEPPPAPPAPVVTNP